jgi:organic hydroperoxide reductase OsmC/OhrA
MKSATQHMYNLSLAWEGNLGSDTDTYTSYSRQFRARIAGKPDFIGSADVAFRGDAAVHNPEDLLVIALSSCHMLSYLALCSKYKIGVVSYEDEARGVMETEGNGGRFRLVTLRPMVVVAAGSDMVKALSLHADASKGCFIAASCNFPIEHEPTITMADADTRPPP